MLGSLERIQTLTFLRDWVDQEKCVREESDCSGRQMMAMVWNTEACIRRFCLLKGGQQDEWGGERKRKFFHFKNSQDTKVEF